MIEVSIGGIKLDSCIMNASGYGSVTKEEIDKLWYNYMRYVGLRKEWMKPIELKHCVPHIDHIPYKREEFLEKLLSDELFMKMWGTI